MKFIKETLIETKHFYKQNYKLLRKSLPEYFTMVCPDFFLGGLMIFLQILFFIPPFCIFIGVVRYFAYKKTGDS